MRNIDKVIKAALRSEEGVSKELNQRLVRDMTLRAEKTLEKGNHKRTGFTRVAVAAVCGIVILCSTSMAYATVKGVDIGSLFAKVWDSGSSNEEGLQEKTAVKLEGTSLEALEGICSEVSVIKANSTFKDINIEPVVAVNDEYELYLVLKIEGDKKLISEKKVAPHAFRLMDEKGGEIVSSYSDYLLSVEENTMYYAMKFAFLDAMKEKTGEYILSVYNLFSIDDVDANGRISRVVHNKDGFDAIAVAGQYDLNFSCTVSGKEVATQVEDKVDVKITPLCAYFNDYIFEGKVNQQDWTVIIEAYLIMDDGSRVAVVPVEGAVEINPYELCELERPVDPDKIKALEFHGKSYPIR